MTVCVFGSVFSVFSAAIEASSFRLTWFLRSVYYMFVLLCDFFSPLWVSFFGEIVEGWFVRVFAEFIWKVNGLI